MKYCCCTNWSVKWSLLWD